MFLDSNIQIVNPVYMNEKLSKFSIQNEIQLRFLNAGDIPELKDLCNDWFPVDYPGM